MLRANGQLYPSSQSENSDRHQDCDVTVQCDHVAGGEEGSKAVAVVTSVLDECVGKVVSKFECDGGEDRQEEVDEKPAKVGLTFLINCKNS